MAESSRRDKGSFRDALNSNTRRPSMRDPLPFQQKNASRIRGATRQHEDGFRDTPVTTVAYYNYTDRDIVITSRDGTAITVNPIGNYAADQIIVCVTHSMSRNSMERALDGLQNRSCVDDRETYYWIRAYEAALHDSSNSNSNRMHRASVEYVITYQDIQDAGGRCYMPDVDLLVEWVADAGATHPFDKVKRDEAMVSSIAPGVGEGTFVFMLKAVDNAPHSQRATRYINLGGEIFSIPIERDLNYPTGVHLVCRTPIQEGEIRREIINREYSFEEADSKWSLHRTVEDAINGGPIDQMAKSIIERETTMRKVGEAKLRTEQLDADAEIQRLRNEGNMAKAQQDKEAADRRNYVEWAKAGVALLGAAITVYGILSKLTTGK